MTETCKPVITHCDILTYGDLNQGLCSQVIKQNKTSKYHRQKRERNHHRIAEKFSIHLQVWFDSGAQNIYHDLHSLHLNTCFHGLELCSRLTHGPKDAYVPVPANL